MHLDSNQKETSDFDHSKKNIKMQAAKKRRQNLHYWNRDSIFGQKMQFASNILLQ